MRDENVFPNFEKKVKGGNFNVSNSNPYLVTSLERYTYQKNNEA